MAVAFNEELRALVGGPADPLRLARTARPRLPRLLVEVLDRELEGLDDAEIWIHTCWGSPNMQRVLDDTSYAGAWGVYLERLKGTSGRSR